MTGLLNGEDAVGLLARLQPTRVLLLGDLLLDRYTYGHVGRISPEAPVPILLIEQEMQMPGGAGNVALNLAGLGNEVYLCTRIGADLAGVELQSLLRQQSHGRIDVSHMVTQPNICTPIKNRLIASGQQLLRVDREKTEPMDEVTRNSLTKAALSCLSKVDIIAVSDYGKGSIDRELLAPIFERAKELGLPIVVDPKSKDLSLYQGATLIKPNLKEAIEASGASKRDLNLVAASIFERVPGLPYLMITRSQDGISLFERNRQRRDFPARAMEVLDVTGAGDCVLAAIVHAMACGISLDGCCHLANIAGALAVQKVGCVQLTLKDVARQMLHSDVNNKIFDESHLFALQEACRGEEVHMIRANAVDLERMDFLLAMNRYRHQNPKALIILQASHRDLSDDFIHVLTEQSSINLLMLIDNDHPTRQIEAHRVLNWKAQGLQPA